MNVLIELGGIVSGFGIQNGEINCLAGNDLVKIIKGAVILQKTVFNKSGAARFYGENDRHIVIADFCTLYAFSKETFEKEHEIKIGTDLTSDICYLLVNGDYAYCSIRNGGIAKVGVSDFQFEIYPTSDASIWEIICSDEILYCGTVDGHILKIDKNTMRIVEDAAISKKNIKSIRKDGNKLYAASQDMKLYVLNTETLKVLAVKRNIHKYMYYIAGVTNHHIVTVSHPASEISVLDKETLETVRAIREPLRLSGPIKLQGGILYYASRNFNGIKMMEIE